MADLKIIVSGSVSALGRELKKAGGMFRKLGAVGSKSFNLSKRAALGIVAVFGAMAASAIRVQAKFETMATSFKVMLRSGNLAADMMERLTEFSVKTPFTPDEIFKAAKTLLGFGVAADDIIGTIQTLGDVSAGSGKDLAELARIYGKVLSLNKIQGEEFQQFASAAIPVIGELKKMLGKTSAEILKMGEKGQITANDMQQAFLRMTGSGGLFENAMAEQSKTLNGLLSTLSGNWDEFQKSLGNTDGIKWAISSLNEMLIVARDINKEFLKSGVGGKTTALDVIGDNLNQINPLQAMSAGVLATFFPPAIPFIARHFLSDKGREEDFGGLIDLSAPTKGQIKLAKDKVMKDREKKAKADAQRKEESRALAAQRAGTVAAIAKKTAESILSVGSASGSLQASLGANLTGSAFSSRVDIQKQQLNKLEELVNLFRQRDYRKIEDFVFGSMEGSKGSKAARQ